jgi:hypothetical protein
VLERDGGQNWIAFAAIRAMWTAAAPCGVTIAERDYLKMRQASIGMLFERSPQDAHYRSCHPAGFVKPTRARIDAAARKNAQKTTTTFCHGRR